MYGQLTKEPAYYCAKEDSATKLAQGSWQAPGHWWRIELPYPQGVAHIALPPLRSHAGLSHTSNYAHFCSNDHNVRPFADARSVGQRVEATNNGCHVHPGAVHLLAQHQS